MNVNDFYKAHAALYGFNGVNNWNEYSDKIITSGPKKGVAVANAAGANPTQAEFNALLTALRNANIIAT